MYFPQLSTPRQSRVTVNRFPGLDRRPRGQEGSFREMENLCAQGYPTLTVRRPRGIAGSVTAPGGLTAKDGLIWVDGHTLYINGSAAGLVLSAAFQSSRAARAAATSGSSSPSTLPPMRITLAP